MRPSLRPSGRFAYRTPHKASQDDIVSARERKEHLVEHTDGHRASFPICWSASKPVAAPGANRQGLVAVRRREPLCIVLVDNEDARRRGRLRIAALGDVSGPRRASKRVAPPHANCPISGARDQATHF